MKAATPAATPVDALLRPDRFFARPLTLFDAFVPLVVAAAVGVWLAHAQQPYFAQAVMQSLPADAAQRLAADGDVLFRNSWIADVGALVRPLLASALHALMALLVLGAIGYTPRFESLQVCAAWSMLILTGKSVLQYFILASTGLDAIHHPADLTPGTGLGFLAAAPQSLSFQVLELVNGFDLAYLYAFAATIRLAAQTSSAHAAAAAALPWVLLSAIRIGFSAILY